MGKIKLDIILPCYNPIEGWVETILESVSSIQERLPNTELFLYLVNDGSSQGVTSQHVHQLEKELPNFQYLTYSKNGGKGFALREGIRHSKHDFCIFTDVDFPYTTESFLRLYEALTTGDAEVVVGHRTERYYDKVPSMRVKISKVFKFFVRKFFQLPVSDTQCGLKGMRTKGKTVFLQTSTNRYLFDLEFIHFVAKQLPGKLKAVEVILKPDIVFSSMNFGVLMREGWSFFLIFCKNFFR